MAAGQLEQGAPAEQRQVDVDDEHVPLRGHGARSEGGMAGASRFRLHGDADAIASGGGDLRLGRGGHDYDDLSSAGVARQVAEQPHHRHTGDVVQRLRQSGTHARSAPGGEHDDTEVLEAGRGRRHRLREGRAFAGHQRQAIRRDTTRLVGTLERSGLSAGGG